MATLARHLAAMAYQNAWANHRLLGTCAALTDVEFAARRTSFFPSIRATANHLLTVDWYYVDALEACAKGVPPASDPSRFFDPEEPFERCAPLREAQRAVDRRLVELCVALRDDHLDRPVAIVRRRGTEHEATSRLLAHLFQHQIHHRGQIHAMLAGTRLAPPQLDEFFCANEAHLRAAELAELGWSEEEVFGMRD